MARKKDVPINRTMPSKGYAADKKAQKGSVMSNEPGVDIPPREAGSKGGEAPPPEESFRAFRGSHSKGKVQKRRRYETKE